jgi:hypothetical protein
MSNAEQERKTESLAGWKKAAAHTVRCPSGVYVDIKVPDLPALIEAGEIPQTLLDAAIGAASGKPQEPSREAIVQQREFTDTLTKISVVSPKLTEADLKDIPFEDKEFIVEIATRQRDLDAEGNHIGGLQKSADFRRFRGLDFSDTDVEDL